MTRLLSALWRGYTALAFIRMCFLRLFALCLILVSTVVARTEAELVLSASHVALVKVREIGERRAGYDLIEVSVEKTIKGQLFGATLSMSPIEGEDTLKKGERYVVFCYEYATGSGVTLYARQSEVIPMTKEESARVERLVRIAQEQRDGLAWALQTTMTKPPPTGEVPDILALLFNEETQREAVRRLLALPEDANRALAMHVHDTRPIPKKMLSPDDPIVFHESPVATCGCIQDVVVWILGLRMKQSFGGLAEASFAARTAIADAWFYWVMAKGRKIGSDFNF